MTAPTDRESAGRSPRDGGPVAAVLARSVLFAGWTPDAIAGVTARFRPRAVTVGEALCRQGDPGDEMYVVEGGRFAVDAVIGGRSVRFAELGPGAVFGEVAVLSRRPRSATVTALVDGYVWALNRADFADLAARHPDLVVTAGRIASARLAEAEQLAGQIGAADPRAAQAPPRASHPDAETAEATALGMSAGMPPGPAIGGQTLAGGAMYPEGLQFAHEPRAVMLLQPRQDAITIGRDARNDVVLDDPRVSRRHALLRKVGEAFRIEDLGSTNGTYVNGERVDQRRSATTATRSRSAGRCSASTRRS